MVVLLGIGAVVIGAFYTASWVPWDMSQRHGTGLGGVSVSMEESEWGFSGPRDFTWSSVRILLLRMSDCASRG